jgi:hypothetical protein
MSVTEIDLKYNKTQILKEIENCIFHPFNDLGPDQNGITKMSKESWFYNPSTWLQSHIKKADLKPNSEIKKIYVQLQTLLKTKDIRARVYKQLANTEVPMHNDIGTSACVNIILSEDYAPITFEECGDIKYKCAILDIQKKHKVKSYPKERILLKFSIFDIDYKTALSNYMKTINEIQKNDTRN